MARLTENLALRPAALRAAEKTADAADPIGAMRRRYVAFRTSAGSFGMAPATFDARVAALRTGDTPAEWLRAGDRAEGEAQAIWKRNESEQRAERLRRATENARSFADEAARRERRIALAGRGQAA